MSYEVLARKWRPGKFSEVVGQAHVVRALQNALRMGRLHHAYLFAGTRGVGKTTLARIFAKCLNCDGGPAAEPCGECSACKAVEQGSFIDLIEVDAASRTGVDDMRELLESSQFVPTIGKCKVYLIDEVHMLSISSFNALLKTLEEPPQHVRFFFATTHPDKLPLTVLSRCLQFNLVRLIPDEISAYLLSLLEQENIKYDEAALQQIALCAEGSMRDALSLLDQAIAYGGGELKREEVETMLGLTSRVHVVELLKFVLQEDAVSLLDKIASLYAIAVDFEWLLGEIITLLHEVAVAQAVSNPAPNPRFKPEDVKELATRMAPEDIQLFYQIGLKGKQDLPFLPDAKAGFEMLMLRMLSFKPLSSKNNVTTTKRSPAHTTTANSDEVPPQTRPDTRKAVASEADASGTDANFSSTVDLPSPNTKVSEITPPAAMQNPELAGLVDLECWSTLIDRLGFSGSEKQICCCCVIKIDAPNTVKLVMNKQDKFIREEQAEAAICFALAKHFGKDIEFLFEVSDLDEETPGQRHQQKKNESTQEQRQELEQNPQIKSLQDNMGATIESVDINSESP